MFLSFLSLLAVGLAGTIAGADAMDADAAEDEPGRS